MPDSLWTEKGKYDKKWKQEENSGETGRMQAGMEM